MAGFRLLAATGLALLLALAAPSRAGDRGEVRLRDVLIGYDTKVWTTAPPAPDTSLTFNCVPPACEGHVMVFVISESLAEPNDPPPDGICPRTFDVEPMGEPTTAPAATADEGRIAFTAFSGWSGCRAMDSPIREACGNHAGNIYRFTTSLDDGCNFEPDIPADLFLALTSDVRAAGPN